VEGSSCGVQFQLLHGCLSCYTTAASLGVQFQLLHGCLSCYTTAASLTAIATAVHSCCAQEQQLLTAYQYIAQIKLITIHLYQLICWKTFLILVLTLCKDHGLDTMEVLLLSTIY